MKNTSPTKEDTTSADVNQGEATVDEYLWPLTGETDQIDWSSLTEELELRRRLAEIAAHVCAMHVQPRLTRWRGRLYPALTHAIRQGVIAGPEGGAPWEQTLKDPVPRALREEWTQLAQRLRALRFPDGSEGATGR